MKRRFYIPPGTNMTLDPIGRVTLTFARQADAEAFFEFIEDITKRDKTIDGEGMADTTGTDTIQ